MASPTNALLSRLDPQPAEIRLLLDIQEAIEYLVRFSLAVMPCLQPGLLVHIVATGWVLRQAFVVDDAFRYFATVLEFETYSCSKADMAGGVFRVKPDPFAHLHDVSIIDR